MSKGSSTVPCDVKTFVDGLFGGPTGDEKVFWFVVLARGKVRFFAREEKTGFDHEVQKVAGRRLSRVCRLQGSAQAGLSLWEPPGALPQSLRLGTRPGSRSAARGGCCLCPSAAGPRRGPHPGLLLA